MANELYVTCTTSVHVSSVNVSIYSVGWEKGMSSMSYSEDFKRTRKLLREGINPKAMVVRICEQWVVRLLRAHYCSGVEPSFYRT